MSNIIPREFPQNMLSDPTKRAEWLVYEALKEIKSSDITVLYSVAWLSPAEGGAQDGEIDFLVLHPHYGIILIEVKGGGIAHDSQEDKWFSIDRNKVLHSIKDPFEQVTRNKHNLIQRIRKIPAFYSTWIDATHTVFFPDTHHAPSMGANAPTEIIGTYNDLSNIQLWLERVYEFSTNHSPQNFVLEQEAISLIEEHLSPTVNIPISKRSTIDSIENQIFELTEEQFSTLDMMAHFRQLKIAGGAGTGKTLLAVEKAKRLQAEGFRVLFCCYNRPLADEISLQLEDFEIDVDTFHQLCYRLASDANLEIPALGFQSFNKLVALAWEALERPEIAGHYDAIIVDEGQDFYSEWWEILQLCLKDGSEGVFYVFYDDNQQLYDTENIINLPNENTVMLTKNIRNTQNIHRLARSYYRGNAYTAGGPKGDPIEYLSADSLFEAQERLRKLLHQLIREEGIKESDIVILTGLNIDQSELIDKKQIGPFLIKNLAQSHSDHIVFDSIRRFKGLDKPIVILIELTQVMTATELLYVALTRARSQLFVIGNEDVLRQVKNN